MKYIFNQTLFHALTEERDRLTALLEKATDRYYELDDVADETQKKVNAFEDNKLTLTQEEEDCLYAEHNANCVQCDKADDYRRAITCELEAVLHLLEVIDEYDETEEV